MWLVHIAMWLTPKEYYGVTKLLSQAKHDHTLVLLGVNHMAMWTRLLTIVNPLGVGHMAMWTMGVNHIKMWTIGVRFIAM